MPPENPSDPKTDLGDLSKDLMLIFGSGSQADTVYSEAVECADSALQQVLRASSHGNPDIIDSQLGSPGSSGYCVLSAVKREVLSQGPLDKLMDDGEPSCRLIQLAFSGALS